MYTVPMENGATSREKPQNHAQECTACYEARPDSLDMLKILPYIRVLRNELHMMFRAEGGGGGGAGTRAGESQYLDEASHHIAWQKQELCNLFSDPLIMSLPQEICTARTNAFVLSTSLTSPESSHFSRLGYLARRVIY